MPTAYCTKCRADFAVAWDNPPYSLRHHGADDEPNPTHSNPETGEPVDYKLEASPRG
jgi:hypothetical protein